MKSIGILIREKREEHGLSLKDLSRSTKIKPEFLDSLEKEEWHKLPELPVTVGFVKSVADVLGISREQAVAWLRRDYPPRKYDVNPSPDIKKEWRLGPRFVTVIGILAILVVLAAYLVNQYKAFTSPPVLSVVSPVSGELVTSPKLLVIGTTDKGAVVRVNGQPVLVNPDGNFSVEIEVASETEELEIKAISRTGRETVIKRPIDVELTKK